MKLAYIVIAVNPMSDFRYHVDSVWTSHVKAEKRCKELNSAENDEWRREYGYGIFEIEQKAISK